MYTLVVSNIKTFALARPPVAAFVLCMLGFAVTMISLSSYVENNSGLRKPEAELDWKNFFSTLSHYEVCLIPSKNNSTSNIVKTDELISTTAAYSNLRTELGRVAIAGSVRIKSSLLEVSKILSKTVYRGQVYLKGWKKVCSHGSVQTASKDSPILLSMYIPHLAPNKSQALSPTSVSETKVCIVLTGPLDSLPPMQEEAQMPLQCPSNMDAEHVNEGLIYYREHQSNSLGEKQEDHWCGRGKTVRLSSLEDIKAPPFLLTQEEKSVINLHLLYTSYVLLAMSVLLVIYAGFCGFAYKTHHVLLLNKEPLDA